MLAGAKVAQQSPPARGAWIEIFMLFATIADALASPPARGAWIEIFFNRHLSFEP